MNAKSTGNKLDIEVLMCIQNLGLIAIQETEWITTMTELLLFINSLNGRNKLQIKGQEC